MKNFDYNINYYNPAVAFNIKDNTARRILEYLLIYILIKLLLNLKLKELVKL